MDATKRGLMKSKGVSAWLGAISLTLFTSSCSKTEQPTVRARAQRSEVETPPSFRDRVSAFEEVRAVVIRYEDFLAMREQQPAAPETRAAAALLARRTTHPNALGVFGELQDGWYVADLFIVAKDLRLSDGFETEYETSDFAVVAMRAEWEGQHIPFPRLGLIDEIKDFDCDPSRRGCHPLFSTALNSGRPHRLATPDEGGAGLPSPIIVNAESTTDVQNAWGYAPELWLVHERREALEEPNRFFCFGAIESPGVCEQLPQAEAVARKAEFQVPFDPTLTFTLISEPDYLRLVERGTIEPLKQEDIGNHVVPAATLANDLETVGISARQEGTYVEGPVVVGRDLRRTEYGLEALSFYFPTVSVFGSVTVSGRDIRFGRSGERHFTMTGPCGPVSLSTRGPCEHKTCIPGEVQMEPMNPRYGTNRWPAKSRATIRVVDLERPRKDVSIYACSEFRPPPIQHRCGGDWNWWVGTEECNGEDDNCNGEIDEGGVCNACVY